MLPTQPDRISYCLRLYRNDFTAEGAEEAEEGERYINDADAN